MIPPASTIPTAAVAVSGQMLNGAALIFGWSFRETTNAAIATVELYDGTSTGGALITSITLAINESTRDLMGGNGLEILTGIYLNVVAGSVKGAVWAVPADAHNLRDVMRNGAPMWDVAL